MTVVCPEVWTMWTGPTPPDSMAVRPGTLRPDVAPDRLVHCGRPMALRGLDCDQDCTRRNDAVLEAAVNGARLYACDCGFLLEASAQEGQQMLAEAEEVPLFQPLFARRVLAAAGRVESAQWGLDQAEALAGPAAARDGAGDAEVEAACWALDQATASLGAELDLAARHGMSRQALAEAAGVPVEEVAALLENTRPEGRPVASVVAA